MANVPLPRPRPEQSITRLDDRRDEGMVNALLSVLAENTGATDIMDIYRNGFQAYANKRAEPYSVPIPTPMGKQLGIDDIQGAINNPGSRPDLYMNKMSPLDPGRTDPAELLAYGHINNPMGDVYTAPELPPPMLEDPQDGGDF
jgi:hypothetical protein